MGLKVVDGKYIETDAPRLRAKFYEHAKRVGPKEFKPVDMIELHTPGVKDFMSRPVTEDDKANYAKEWTRYQAGIQELDDGATPLTVLKRFKEAFRLDLEQRGIHTVEELSALPEAPEEYLEGMWKESRVYVRVQDEMRDEQNESQLTG